MYMCQLKRVNHVEIILSQEYIGNMAQARKLYFYEHTGGGVLLQIYLSTLMMQFIRISNTKSDIIRHLRAITSYLLN
jgi:hypothetical protein